MIKLGTVCFSERERETKNNNLYDCILALEFFKTISIRLIGGISFGLIAGLLEIIGLPYLYDDPISEITITIAVPYILYWLCKYNLYIILLFSFEKNELGEQLYCSGVIAIVVLGLLLSNHKTAISSEISIFMEKYIVNHMKLFI